MNHGAQIHLAAEWCRPIAEREGDALATSLRWADTATTNGPGGLVTRRLVASRAGGLMPVIMDLAGMPLADGEEAIAFGIALRHLHAAARAEAHIEPPRGRPGSPARPRRSSHRHVRAPTSHGRRRPPRNPAWSVRP